MMEIIEGDIRVTQVPSILIGDKPLGKCAIGEVAVAILALVKRVGTQRDEIEWLKKELKGHITGDNRAAH